MSNLDETGSPTRREEGSSAGCLALQSGEEVTKCITVTCPECGYSFDACFIDYGVSETLDWFTKCPKCEARFPVAR